MLMPQTSSNNNNDNNKSFKRSASASFSSLSRPPTSEDLTNIVMEDMLEDSKFFARPAPNNLPSFDPSEVQVGQLLGHGQFGQVLELTKLSPASSDLVTDCDCSTCHGSKDTTSSLTGSILIEKDSVRRSFYQHRARQLSSSSCFCVTTATTQQDGAASTGFPKLSGHDTEDTEDIDEEYEECSSMGAADHPEQEDGQGNNNNLPQKPQNGIRCRKTTPTEAQRRSARMVHHVTTRAGVPRYAVKRVHPAIVNPELAMDAIIDLTCEAMFLRQLPRHSNIIRLKATVGTPGTASFMLILDRLTGNLHSRLDAWRQSMVVHSRSRGWFGRRLTTSASRHSHGGLEASLYVERLVAAFDIARALRHLHQHSILYRDIKPENIGVDIRGDFVLFDFGLAKELKRRDLVCPPDGYHATGVTGSRRYMAPEVVKSLPYGFKADVYSFGILLWEIMALKTPFPHFDVQKHFDVVVAGGKRPSLKKSWPVELRALLAACWAASPADRLDVATVCTRLQNHIVERNNAVAQSTSLPQPQNAVENVLHMSRRSLYLASRQVSIEAE